MGGAKVFCSECRNRRAPKKIPYGAKRIRAWCDGCDADRVPPQPNKKLERQRAKLEVKKEIKNIGGHCAARARE